MTYQSITNQILELIKESSQIIIDIHSKNDLIKKGSNKEELIEKIKESRSEWFKKSISFLEDNDLILEKEEFVNYSGSPDCIIGFNMELNDILNFMKDRKALLIHIAKEIESKNKREVEILHIDDFDNFSEIRNVHPFDVKGYVKDCFLEDDIEEAFLEKLGEPYKEADGGAETRDLFTNRISYQGKRLSTAIMFKGRGQPGELTIKKSGSTGNQLLKLAKNNAAECFIVQHINKISTDVQEALQDHILQNTRLSQVYICFIDGVDTARFLKSMNKNLKELKEKNRTPPSPSDR